MRTALFPSAVAVAMTRRRPPRTDGFPAASPPLAPAGSGAEPISMSWPSPARVRLELRERVEGLGVVVLGRSPPTASPPEPNVTRVVAAAHEDARFAADGVRLELEQAADRVESRVLSAPPLDVADWRQRRSDRRRPLCHRCIEQRQDATRCLNEFDQSIRSEASSPTLASPLPVACADEQGRGRDAVQVAPRAASPSSRASPAPLLLALPPMRASPPAPRSAETVALPPIAISTASRSPPPAFSKSPVEDGSAALHRQHFAARAAEGAAAPASGPTVSLPETASMSVAAPPPAPPAKLWKLPFPPASAGRAPLAHPSRRRRPRAPRPSPRRLHLLPGGRRSRRRRCRRSRSRWRSRALRRSSPRARSRPRPRLRSRLVPGSRRARPSRSPGSPGPPRSRSRPRGRPARRSRRQPSAPGLPVTTIVIASAAPAARSRNTASKVPKRRPRKT